MCYMVGRATVLRTSRKYESLDCNRVHEGATVTRMHQSKVTDAPPEQSIPERLAHPVPEAAVLLGLGERFTWTLVESGELASFKSGGRRLVAREDINAYIKRRREEDQRARAENAA